MVIGGVKRVIVDDMGNPVGYSTEERQQALTVSLCYSISFWQTLFIERNGQFNNL